MQNKEALTSTEIEKLFSLKSLQNIADNISSLIQYDIVIANHKGVVIAASRKSRIGVFNPRIKEMIENNAEMHIVYDVETGEGFLPGINLPIRFEGSSIASVGITGNPEDVKIFGKVIQSFVQQQLVDMAHEKEKANRRQILNSFIYDWIFNTSYSDKEEFELRARSLNINAYSPRVISIVKVTSDNPAHFADDFLIQMQQQIAGWLRSLDRQHVVALLGSEIVVLLNTGNSAVAERVMGQVWDTVKNITHVPVAIGIGMSFDDREKVRLSYEAAKLACKTAEESPDQPVCVFGSFDFRLLISSISRSTRQQVFNSVYQNYTSDEQISSSIMLLRRYVENNRSISQTAAELYLHKNTIQAHLNRIFDLTGYNPRDARDLTLLYATTYMYEMGIRKEEFD